MRRSVLRTRHVPAAVIAAVTAVLLLTACGGQGTSASQTSPGHSATADTAAGGRTVTALERPVPQRVTIPSLGVSSTPETLAQNADGAMTTPKNPDLAGLYEPGPPQAPRDLR